MRRFTPKNLLKILYFLLLNSSLIYSRLIRGQDRKLRIQEDSKISRKSNKDNNSLFLNAPTEKQMYETNILKL